MRHQPGLCPEGRYRGPNRMPAGARIGRLRRPSRACKRSGAGAAVQALAERLRPDRAAGRAGLRGAARIDQHGFGSSACSLEPDELDEQRPCGVVDGPGRHPAFEPGEVEVFARDTLYREMSARESLCRSSRRCRVILADAVARRPLALRRRRLQRWHRASARCRLRLAFCGRRA